MKVILRDDIPTLGEAGDVVTVKDGYARNYLIPRSLVYVATKANLRVWEDEKRLRLMRIARETNEAEKVKVAVEQLTIKIRMHVGEEGRLFGSVTNRMVADELREQHDFDMDHRHIIIDEPIRSQGEFVVNVRLAHGVVADLKVVVESLEGEPGPVAEEPADEIPTADEEPAAEAEPETEG